MNVFQLLAIDHVKANTLLNEIASSSEYDIAMRARLCSELKRELELHSEGEKAHFYPALKRHPETSEFVQDALRVHDRMETALADIEDCPPDSREFLEKVGKLEELLLLHVQQEETEIFPTAERTFSPNESNVIAEKIAAMRPTRLQPAE